MAYEFSENIQRGILYLLKSHSDFFAQIVGLVKPDYFEYPVHSNIFSVVRDYHEKYDRLPTDEFILEEVKNVKKGREDLADYQDEIYGINSLDTSALENPEYFLDLVEEFARKEAMKAAISQSIVLMKEDRMGEIETLVRKALTVSRNVDTGQPYFNAVLDRWKREIEFSQRDRYKTILPTLNKSLEGGLSAKELAMVVAPPGVGKSLFLVNQGVQSMMEGRKVLYVSLEMSEDKIAQRFDSVMTLIPQPKLREPAMQITLKERLQLFKEEFEGSDLVIKEFPTGCATVNDIRALLVQLKNYEDFVPDLILVDYLELLRPTKEIQHEYVAQQRISEDLRGLAMQQNILLWTATQTNRMGTSVKIITDNELGDSYGKIRTCDFCISLNQDREEFDNGRMRTYVIKSRNGRPRFLVPMDINYSTLRMGESGDEFES
mgnify:CR=1 FL=1